MFSDNMLALEHTEQTSIHAIVANLFRQLTAVWAFLRNVWHARLRSRGTIASILPSIVFINDVAMWALATFTTITPYVVLRVLPSRMAEYRA